MIEGLRRNGVEVVECHEVLWGGIEDRVRVVSGGWARLSFLKRILRAYFRLIVKHCSVPPYDVMVIGYPGHLDAYVARLLTWLRRAPLVMDVFMSPYLIAAERGLVQDRPFTRRLLLFFEKLAYWLPDQLVQDTAAYVGWFGDQFGLDPSRFRLVPTGADDRIYHPVDSEVAADVFLVTYYGSFIRNHGVPHIVGAAKALAEAPDIQFELIGQGPERGLAEELVSAWGLENVRFVDWLEPEELVERTARSQICLGAFGVTPQSLMTVQNKIFECLAMRKPVVSGDSPTMRAVFESERHLLLVPRGSGGAIADAILQLRADVRLRESLAQDGYELFQQEFTVSQLGLRFLHHLEEVAAR